MEILNFTLISFFLASFVYLWLKWHFSYWKRRGVIEIPPKFVMGNMKLNEHMAVTFRKIYDSIKKKGLKFAGGYWFFKRVFIPIDPDLIKNIMSKDFQYFNCGMVIFQHEKDILSNNLVNTGGDKWRNIRTKLTPTFSSGKLKLISEGMSTKANTLREVAERCADNNEAIDIKDMVIRYTIDVFVTTCFGLECNSLEQPDSAFVDRFRNVMNMSNFALMVQETIPWSVLGNLGWKALGSPNFEKYFVNLIRESMRVRENSKVERHDFLQSLLKLRKEPSGEVSSGDENGLTDNNIAAEAFIFYVGGFETTAVTLTFTLFNLALHKNIQDKLREEVRTVLKKHKGEITYDSVMDMDYLEQCILESQRLYPPFAILTRTCSKEYTVPGTNTVIEKGTSVIIPNYGVHHDPNFYENPETYNPENFSKESKSKRPETTILTFGYGPKMCIGMRFALLNVRMVVATIITNFEILVNEKTKLPIEIDPDVLTTSAKGKVWLSLKKLSCEV